MHEMGLVVAVIVLTLLVMGGLVIIFRRWLTRREELMKRAWGTAEAVGEPRAGSEAGLRPKGHGAAVA